MEFQLKYADSGYSQLLQMEHSARGENLIQHIRGANKYEDIEPMFLTKSAYFIRPEDHLQKVLIDPKGNQTISGKQYKNGNSGDEMKACLYYFNLKDRNKGIETIEKEFKKQKMSQLEKQLQQRKNLTPKLIQLESLASLYDSQVLAGYSRLVQMIDNVRKTYLGLGQEYNEMKEIIDQNQRVSIRCENQRKASRILTQFINHIFSHMKSKGNDLIKSKDALKSNLMTEDNLRDNSGFFQNKKKQEQGMLIHQQKVNEFRSRVQTYGTNLRVILKHSNDPFRQSQSKVMNFGNEGFQKKIQQKLENNTKQYNSIMVLFKNLVQTQDYKFSAKIQNSIVEIQKSLSSSEMVSNYELLYKTLTDYYCDLSQVNQRNKGFVRSLLRQCLMLKNKQGQVCQEMLDYERLMMNELGRKQNKVMKQQSFIEKNSQIDVSYLSAQSQKSLESFKQSIKTEAEIKRRVKFYKKLMFIQSLVFKLSSQEQTQRKKYLIQNKKGKQNNKQLLNNFKVPNFQVDIEGTSDVELMKSNKHILLTEDELTVEQFMLSEFNRIAEHVNTLVGRDANKKIKNLQQLLNMVSQVFKKVYDQNATKLITQNKQMKTENDQINIKIKLLEEKCSKYKSEISQLHNNLEILSNNISKKEQCIVAIQSLKNQEIEKERSRYERMLTEKKKLEANLKSQMLMSQEIYGHMQSQDEDLEAVKHQNFELKDFLAQKEVLIAKLQQQLNGKPSKVIFPQATEQNMKGETQLKQIVIQNLGQKLKYNNNEEQTTRLKQEIAILQQDNDSLQQELNTISCQLNKIILKETEEVEIQVDLMEQSVIRHEVNGVTVGEEIVVGQSCIFMPYGDNVYVGVYHKDEERTLCNMSGIYQTNYLLNLESFNSKTRQILRQCSLLVILKVDNITKSSQSYHVEGRIQYLLGFDQQSLAVKNYAPLLG